ncbi:MAG: hypothetical protein JWM80_1255 [Cyanobacteria bacterium RYN_339]|nr:hypothetical protein [Cyanobacteria bacterium RYN_339]
MPFADLPPALYAAPFQLAAASKGIDLNDEEGTQQKKSSRTGHAAFTAAELKKELAALPADQRKEYDAVRKLLASEKPAQEQLEALAAKHRLSYKDINGHSVLDNLALIASKPTNHGIDKAGLARDLIQDICRPSTIDQAAHATCTATSIQSAIARNNPGEYARFVAEIGTKGTSKSRDGKWKLIADLYLPYKDRSNSSNLLQPAIMELEAQNNGGHYDNKTDKTKPAKGPAYAGAGDQDVAVVATALLGKTYKVFWVKSDNHKEAVKLLLTATPKEPLIVGVWTKGGGGHEMQVVGYEAAQKQVVFRNPWGITQRVAVDTFLKSTDGVVYKAD